MPSHKFVALEGLNLIGQEAALTLYELLRDPKAENLFLVSSITTDKLAETAEVCVLRASFQQLEMPNRGCPTSRERLDC